MTAQTGSLAKALVVLTSLVAMAVGLVPMFAVGVIAVFLREDLSTTAGTIGLLPSALFVVGAGTSPAAGRIADRWPIALSLSVLFVAAAGTWVLFASMRTVTGAVLSLAAAGPVLALSIPVISRLVYETFTGSERGWALGMAHTGSQAGAVLVGALLPGLSLSVGWRQAFSGLAVVPLGGLVFTLLLLFLAPRVMTQVGAFEPFFRRRPRRTRLRPIILLATVANACAVSLALYLPTFSIEHVGVDLRHAGFLIVGFAVVSALGKVSWGRVRVSTAAEQQRSVRMLTLLGTVGVAVITVSPWWGSVGLWVGAMIFGFSVTSWTVLCTRLGAQMVGIRELGDASAQIVAAGYLAGAIGPVLFGALVDGTEAIVGWTVMVAVLLASAALLRPVVPVPEMLRR